MNSEKISQKQKKKKFLTKPKYLLQLYKMYIIVFQFKY